MRALTRFFLALFIVIFLSALHIGLSFILPSPWSKINIILVVLIVLMFWWDSGMIVWLSFFAHLIIELYTTAPFGILLASGTLSLLISFWLYRYFFTNRSWYAAGALGFLTLIIYRAIYIIAISLLKFFGLVQALPWLNILQTLSWELVFSVPAIALLFFVVSRFSRRLNASFDHSSLFKV